MSHLQLVPKKEHLIREAFQDFILSKQAALLSPRTVEFYEYTCSELVEWLEQAEILDPQELRPAHMRGFLSHVAERDVKDSTIHAFARGCRAFCRFMHREGYRSRLMVVNIPWVATNLY